jgi:hypothetical protein
MRGHNLGLGIGLGAAAYHVAANIVEAMRAIKMLAEYNFFDTPDREH